MQHFADEILQRFPEVADELSEGDEELPYVMVGHVVRWLRAVAKPALDADVVRRVVEFDRWCMSQPGGEAAENDIPTIAVVALREKLFKYDELLPLVPRVMTRQELLQNRDYLVGWVGADRYEAVLRMSKGGA